MSKTYVEGPGDEIIEVHWNDIKGRQQMADGSWRFKLVGGPYHDSVIRVYPPCDRIVFPSRRAGEEPAVYEINPPVNKRSDAWCYVYNPLGDTSPMETKKIIRKERLLDNGNEAADS